MVKEITVREDFRKLVQIVKELADVIEALPESRVWSYRARVAAEKARELNVVWNGEKANQLASATETNLGDNPLFMVVQNVDNNGNPPPTELQGDMAPRWRFGRWWVNYSEYFITCQKNGVLP